MGSQSNNQNILKKLPKIKFLVNLNLMHYLFWSCLLCLIPGLLIRIPFGGGGILLSDILVPLFALWWVAHKLIIDRSFPMPRFVVPALGFVFVALLSWIWGAWDLELKAKILSFSYLVRFASIVILGWAVVDWCSPDPPDKGELKGVLFYRKTPPNLPLSGERSKLILLNLFKIVGIVILLGYVQFYLVPDLSNFSTVGGFDPHVGRLLGTWMDPNFVGGLLAFFLPLMIGFWYQSDSPKTRLWLGALVLICVYALFLTFSRSAYLAAVGGMGLFFLLRDPKIILLGILLAGIGLATNERAQQRVGQLTGTMASVILRDTDEIDPTAKLRVQSWQRSLELWQKYPVLGIGYNTYRFRGAEEGVVDETYFSAGGSDSTLLTILVTTGVFGFLAFLWFYADLWFKNFFRWRRSKPSSGSSQREESKRTFSYLAGGELYLGFVAGWSAILVHSVFVNSFLFPLIFMPMMVVAGVLEARDRSL